MLPAFLVARWLLLLILLAGVYFFGGFLVPVLAALIVGLASWPLYQRWLRACGGRNILAASVAITVVIVVAVVPLSMALSYAIKEASNAIA
ncbi:putative membrane protein [plant metagenome]